MGQLLTIMYVSKEHGRAPWTSENILALEKHASQKNARLGITGFLLYTKPYLLQAIEGPPETVKVVRPLPLPVLLPSVPIPLPSSFTQPGLSRQ